MLKWLSENIGTVIVLAVLIVIVVAIIVYRIKAKKRGESSCGCKCSDCAGCSTCHAKTDGTKPSK